VVPRYAAFIRGINLGSQRRVSGAELRGSFEELGFHDVGTFRTSGNVVLETSAKDVAELSSQIEKGLSATFGFETAVFLRTASQMRALADHQPFPTKKVEASKGKLQVMLLSAKPAKRAREQTLALATDQDALALGDRELYWLPSGGTRDSALDIKAIEGLIGPTTTRTKATIEQLAAKYFAE
jgi:uncharacterized protein (DUF1697 family)